MDLLKDPRIGALGIYLAVMAKLNAGKWKKNAVYSYIAGVLFISGWVIISRSIEAKLLPNLGNGNSNGNGNGNGNGISEEWDYVPTLLQISIGMIIAGAMINRMAFDYGAKKPIGSAMAMFMLGWVFINILFMVFGNASVTDTQKGTLAVGSVVTLMGVMMNRQGELRKMNPAFGAVTFLIGWGIISSALTPIGAPFQI